MATLENATNDLIRNTRKIELIIKTIQEEGQKTKALIEAKAETARLYDKAIATVSAKCRLEGMPATLISAQAKGDASQLLSEKIVAEESLKAHWHRIEYLKAQMNGFQSVNRHLDAT